MENKNKPAFPIVDEMGYCATDKYMESDLNIASGLTKREYFAAMAMQGYMANQNTPHQDAAHIAKYSLEYADELLKQLKP